jgi:ectoine hydroxylase-related dioxygenase (phytanoyl-CoA dioxygenase family)
VWTGLVPIDEERGCMTFYPGTHKRDLPHVDPPEDEPVYPEPMVDPEHLDESERVTMELEPGEAVLFNERAVHGSFPNTSDGPRTALVGRYTLPLVHFDRSHERMYDEHKIAMVSGENEPAINPVASHPAD